MTTLGTIINKFDNEIVRLGQDRELLEPFLIEGKTGASKKTLFTRNRVFDLSTLIYFLITPRAASMPVELEEFFKNHCLLAPTKSAISQRRRNISHDVLIYLNNNLLSDYYSHQARIGRWKGLLILAVDGTTITMPRGARFESLFGYASTSRTDRKVPTARVVYIVDAISHIIVAAVIGRYDDDETSLAMEAIKTLPDYLANNSIMLMDRLYLSYVFCSALNDMGIQYVMRARRNFNPDIDKFFGSKNTEEDMLIRPTLTSINTKISKRLKTWNLDASVLRPLTLHLTKSKLPGGDTEVIISNVWSVHISAAQAYRLYGQRWGVEVVIGQEKNEEQVEIFSGYSKECILQDFFAKIITHNITQIATNEAVRWNKTRRGSKSTETGKTKGKGRAKPDAAKDNNAHPHAKSHTTASVIVKEQANMNIGLYLVKKFISAFHMSRSKRGRFKAIRDLVLEMSRFRFRVIPGRHFARIPISYKSSGKYYTATNYRRVV